MCKAPFLAIAFLSIAASASWAQGQSCESAAADKKLADAPKTAFLKKCEKDAAASCEVSASEKKLAGAAKSSFTKKCVKDAVSG